MMGPGLRLTLMRGFEMRRDGRVVELPMSSQRVLAFLALQDRSLPRGYVAETLWCETAGHRAAGSLRSALWRLGRLGHQAVVAAGSQLQLAPEVAVDVREAERAASRLGGTVPDGDRLPDQRIFEGELLVGWCDEWVLDRREQCRQRGLHALEALCERLTAAGRYCDAVQAGLAAVGGDPLRESAHRVLIAAHLAEGNVSEALRQYDRFGQLLMRELGLRPTEALRRVLGGAAAASAPAV
jgi:DNA-binding SARP family transcriptional activator